MRGGGRRRGWAQGVRCRGLCAVDASMMPLIPQANTQETAYAMAKKAADRIKKGHGL